MKILNLISNPNLPYLQDPFSHSDPFQSTCSRTGGLRPKCKFSRPAFQHNCNLIIPLPPPSLANPVQPHSSNISTSPPSRSKEADTKRRLFFFSENKSNSLRSGTMEVPEVKAIIKPAIPRSLPCPSQRGRVRLPNTETYQRAR